LIHKSSLNAIIVVNRGDEMYCKECGTKLYSDALFCHECGQRVSSKYEPIHGTEEISKQESALAITDDLKANTFVEDMYTFVGTNQSYYETKWGEMEGRRHHISWNFAAFFFTIFWLGYRKMFREVFIVSLILMAINLSIYWSNTQFNITLYPQSTNIVISVIVSIVMGLYGNAIYKRHVQRKVQAIYRKQSSVDLQQNLFKRKGRVNFLGVLLASLIVIAVYVIPSIYIPFDPAGIEQIRNGSFYNYDDHIVGETFDQFFDSGSWEQVSSHEDYHIIAFYGEKAVDGYTHDIEIEFILKPTTQNFDIKAVFVDDNELTTYEIFDFLDYIHGENPDWHDGETW